MGGTDGAITNLDAGIVYPLEVKNSGLTHPSIATLLVHPDGKVFTVVVMRIRFHIPVTWWSLTERNGPARKDILVTIHWRRPSDPVLELYIKRRDNLHRLINGVWDTLSWPCRVLRSITRICTR